MKILYHHRIASKDGQYVHVEELIRALRDLGHEVVIVGPPTVERARFGSSGGAFARLKQAVPAGLYELAELSFSFVAFAKLAAAAVRHRPDCLYERYNLYLPAGVWLKRRFALPMLLEVNAPLFEERNRYGGLANRRLAAWSERYAWRGADRVITVTRVLAERIRRRGVEEGKIEIIPNAVNPARFAMRASTAEAKRRLGLEGRFVLGFVGFVREWHGLDRIVDLLAGGGRDDMVLMIVGDGPSRPGLERQAEELGLANRVRFTGVVPRDAVADHVASFDVALQPKVVDYACPLKILEYLALGRAIVAPATANIRELVEHEKTALLFDPDDGAGLAAAIDRLYRDPELRDSIARAARESVDEQGISWERNARRVVELYRDLGVTDASGGNPA